MPAGSFCTRCCDIGGRHTSWAAVDASHSHVESRTQPWPATHCRVASHGTGAVLFVLSLDPCFAVRVYVYVEGHRMAADWAVFDVVLVRTLGDVHRDHDLFAA